MDLGEHAIVRVGTELFLGASWSAGSLVSLAVSKLREKSSDSDGETDNVVNQDQNLCCHVGKG